MSHALELQAIEKNFDGYQALDGASLIAHWGEVHALLGENGAGKSSLMNIAAGLYAPEAGQMLVDDNVVRLSGPRDAARHQIGMVHQHFKLVSPFTVAENVLLGLPLMALEAQGQSYHRRLASVRTEIVRQSGELGFSIDPDRPIKTLSVAEQQRVEILKVLLAGARILILDEPTAVLTDSEAERLLCSVRSLARQGAAVILVTHKMADVQAYADRVTVMRGGRTLVTVDPRQTSTSELVKLTVGETQQVPAEAPVGAECVRSPCLLLRGLRSAEAGQPVLDGLSLQVRSGEIYGLAGVGGNGQEALAQAIMGLLPLATGELELAGVGNLRVLAPEQRRDLGVAVIPADRYGLALAGGLSVAENFGISQVHSGRYGSVWRLDRRAMDEDAMHAVSSFDVLGVTSVRQKAARLSGGNAQKLVIAREFSRVPRLVLAHSPSRGLDARASAQVHSRLRAARKAGAGVLLISEDLDEVLALADRIGVIVRGRVAVEFAAPAQRQEVGKAMVAH